MQTNQSSELTVQAALDKFLSILKESRSANTHRTYQNGLLAFSHTLTDHGYDLNLSQINKLTEDTITWFSDDLKYLSPATEQLYLMAAVRFFEFLAAEKLSTPNLVRLKLLIRSRSRRPGVRLPQFPDEYIANLIEHAIYLTNRTVSDDTENLRNFRDRAFILSLADTGLRVHEACGLNRGDLDWNEGRALIIGKGNRQAVVRFSGRSLNALRDYLSERATLDGKSGRPLATLPLFARHDKGAGKKIKPITTTTGRNIVKQRVIEANGPEAAGLVTPHSLRHYFVTTVLRASGNLKVAQELARHQNIAVTQRYAHLSNDELDKNYYDIFDK